MTEEKHSREPEQGQHGALTTGAAKPDDYWKTKEGLDKKGVKLFTQTIFYDWCKACGICVAFCPKQVFDRDEAGKAVVKNPDACIGCRFCEIHCPDFAITITDRYPDRRQGNRD